MPNPQIVFAARSDKGCARRNNEDNLYCCGTILTSDRQNLPFKTGGVFSAPAVFAVFDGVGGEQLGEQASLTAAQTLAEHADRICSAGTAQIDSAVKVLVDDINRRIREESKTMSVRMGTTMALAVVTQSEIRAYNIGDSRIYMFDERTGLRVVSIDHTLAMRRVKAGLVSETEARRSGDWSKLTACLGIAFENGLISEPYMSPPVPLSGKVRLLLCSDGLTDMVQDERIEHILGSCKNIEKAVQELMSEALNRWQG